MTVQKLIPKLAIVLTVGLSLQAFPDQVQFSVSYTDSDGQGFYDSTFGTARQSAFEYACNIWSGYLGTSYAGETIHVSASFTSMGGTSTSATLGSAGPYSIFRNSSTYGYWANSANANHWSQTDLDASSVEIVAGFNSDVDNSTVLGSTDFYYGLDGNCGSDIDFVSVLLHEIGHGLGFTPLIDSTTGAYIYSDIPSIYGYFLGMYNGSDFSLLTGMNDAERLAAITSDNLYWLGDNAVTANGGNAVKIYAPEIWEQGSSVSHEDETAFPNALMSPYYSGVIHSPDEITLGMLGDMGWSIIPEPSPVIMITLVCAAAFWIRRRFYD